MKKIIIAFLTWRIALFVIAAVSPLIIPKFGARFPYYQERLISSGLPHLLWSFGNFDGVHYLGIAKNAYADQFTQAFFPFYPLMIRAVSQITLGNLVIAGLLVSNIAFLAGLIIFYKLISQTYGEKIAFWSCLFLLAFPTSYYFGAIYTEGLFFLLVIASFYFFHKGKLWQAAVIGALASATRLVGIFLAPALLLKKNKKSIVPLLVVPLGFLAYVLYLKIEFNNPLYFLSSQEIFGQERATGTIILLPQVVYRYLKILLTTSGSVFANALFELISALFAIGLLVFSFKKIQREWLIFSLLAVIMPTLTGTFASMPRYILIAFPIYIILATIKDLKIKVTILVTFLILLVVATTLFTQGYWIA